VFITACLLQPERRRLHARAVTTAAGDHQAEPTPTLTSAATSMPRRFAPVMGGPPGTVEVVAPLPLPVGVHVGLGPGCGCDGGGV
jgi:hypothetical protein